jgi:hypothetical protein
MKNNGMNLRSTKTVRIEKLVGPAWYKSYLVSPEKEKREKEHHETVPERRRKLGRRRGIVERKRLARYVTERGMWHTNRQKDI